MISATEIRNQVALLLEDGVRLIRKEFELVVAELADKAAQVRSAIVMLLAGLLIVLVAVGFLGQAAVIYLTAFVSPLVATLIVSGVLLLAGVVLLARGRTLLSREKLVPRQSLETARMMTSTMKGRNNE